MSMMYCHTHDRYWDSDDGEPMCPRCWDEGLSYCWRCMTGFRLDAPPPVDMPGDIDESVTCPECGNKGSVAVNNEEDA